MSRSHRGGDGPWQPPTLGMFDLYLVIGLVLFYIYMEFCL